MGRQALCQSAGAVGDTQALTAGLFGMAKIRVLPIHEPDFPAIAEFLAVQRADEQGAAPDVEGALLRLRWQALEKPAPRLKGGFGYSIEDSEGRVAGTHLAFPQQFKLGDHQLVGLVSGDLRARDDVSVQSSAMFFAFLRMKGVDFHYATTANRFAAAYWEQQKSHAVEGSDYQFIVPLRAGPLLEELRLQGRLPLPPALLKPLGVAASGLMKVGRTLSRGASSKGLRVEVCEDLEKLSALAEAGRDPTRLTTERSVPYLRWRYLDCAKPELNELLHLQDSAGNEGFAATRRVSGGLGHQIDTVQIQDLVWPRRAMNPAAALEGLVQRYAGQADVVRFKGRASLAVAALAAGFRRRDFESPTSYVIGQSSTGKPLGQAADFVDADDD